MILHDSGLRYTVFTVLHGIL